MRLTHLFAVLFALFGASVIVPAEAETRTIVAIAPFVVLSGAMPVAPVVDQYRRRGDGYARRGYGSRRGYGYRRPYRAYGYRTVCRRYGRGPRRCFRIRS
ncbi:hypothetical protein [uncultured Sphingomonas sp.]|uniref:hypothetical protein n=1 Tax=uncultured Sphingomonas sp. TaxID=158754 RepID=UPI0035CB8B08